MSGSKGKDDADLTEEEQLAEVISSLNELDPGLADTSARPHVNEKQAAHYSGPLSLWLL